MIKKGFREILFLLLFILISDSKHILADIAPTIPWEAHCVKNEKEIQCKYILNDYFSPPIFNDCLPYENNKKYHLLTSEKDYNSVSNKIILRQKYCVAEENIDKNIVYSYLFKRYVSLLLLTLTIEVLIIYFLKLLKSLDFLFAFLTANVFSVLFLLIFWWHFQITNIYFILIAEVVVFLFESCFLILAKKDAPRKKIFLDLFIANFISFIGGSIVFYKSHILLLGWLLNVFFP